MFSKILKTLCVFILLVTAFHCSSYQSTTPKKQIPKDISVTDTIKIVHKESNYEIIIIDQGFNFWLMSTAKQRGFYNQSYLEIKNIQLVTNWNLRVSQPLLYSSDLYTMPINYDSNINYGYEVNYLLYNYFLYFQQKYRQNLLGNTP